MKKLILIGLKDVRLAFRDRTALLMMLLAPFVLTLGIGFVTGRFSGSGGISPAPVALVNLDSGPAGGALAGVLTSPEAKGMVTPTDLSDSAAARAEVDAGKLDAAIIVPANFTASLRSPAAAPIELYLNPTTPTGDAVVKSILDQYLAQVDAGRIEGQVIAEQMAASHLVPAAAQKLGAPAAQAITLQTVSGNGAASAFDPLAIIAPGMALMFLMWSASYGGRVLLAERAGGTLPRLLVSPTTTVEVMGGKILGTFLTGVAQVAILILGTTLMFHLAWGDPLALAVVVAAAVFAAVGWGMLITAVAKTPGQVTNIGSALMLLFGLLGGSFFSLDGSPAWFQSLSKITPNAWGLNGFTILATGGRLADVVTPVLALVAMGAVLFGLAVILFNRRGIMER